MKCSKCSGRWLCWPRLQETQWTNTSRWHGSPNYHLLWKLHTGLQATWILCLSTLPPFPFKCNVYFHLKKRTLDHRATVQFFFSLAQVRCFWQCFCFRSGLVALFLKMSERGDSWCTDSSFSSHLLKLSEELTVSSSLQSSLLLVHIFLPNFFPPVNFAFNMLWYSSPLTATPFSNDPLWLILFVEGANDRLLDHCQHQVSIVPHYFGFKEQDIPTIYTVWMVIYWNSKCKYSNISNILIFYFH